MGKQPREDDGEVCLVTGSAEFVCQIGRRTCKKNHTSHEKLKLCRGIGSLVKVGGGGRGGEGRGGGGGGDF